ncbi:NAD(P)-dependent oxidoreductase [Alkaliphilus transvaalensis]|uniref:NAD(P)-dependent oxidoreductase n=1 Tax=Alkaliphilus transvaalensis TaxID=114628 RepID=UPI00047C4CEE|nr:NAD(P)-dependent oxidoreductase [Alkaliphilus transvaalensis]
MENIVFLNAEKLDFDHQLDFSALWELGNFTKYEDSSEDEIIERVQGQSIIITKELPLTQFHLENFPSSVKLICEAGTGFNNIDIAAAKKKGITVCNVPGYSTEAVAQLAMTLILNFASSLIQQQRMIHKKDFSNFTKHLQVPHFELKNKTLGVIGTGTIGQQLIKLARAFDMEVLAFNRTLKTFQDPHVKSVPLDELLVNSDFVSIHCPLTADTKHLINRDKLELMKPTAFIINTSRGPIIKEVDLIEALQEGIIAGAGLDVQDPEPPELNNPLFTMENVILTPHIGWRCIESRQRLIHLLADNIKSYTIGKPVNIVG